MTTQVCRPLAVAWKLTLLLIVDCKLVLLLPVDHSYIDTLPLDCQIDQSTSCLMHTLAPVVAWSIISAGATSHLL